MKVQIRRKITLLTVLVFCPLITVTGPVFAIQADNSNAGTPALQSDPDIEAILKPLIEKKKFMPGIVAAIAHEGKPIQIAAAGVRKAGSPTSITINDQMHLGSCTKAMTATAVGRLMDQKKISLDWTIGEALPDLSEKIHEDYAKVTLRQLLQHRSGMPANARWWLQTGDDLSERRRLIAIASLQDAPLHQSGSDFQYSNLGYMVAGLMAATAANLTWEELMQQEVFKPLNITSAGFGVPGELDEIVQPWGHRLNDGKPFPIRFDNPSAIGPAGTVHMNLNDWGKFALAHAKENDIAFLSTETLKALHDAGPQGSYALGWGVAERPWAGGKALSHSGSNTSWFCTVWVAPEKQVAYLVATNVDGEGVRKIVDGLIAKLIEIDQK